MPQLVPRLRTAPLVVPSLDTVADDVAVWETNAGRRMYGFATDEGCWIVVEGATAFAFGDSGDVLVAEEDGLPPGELEELWQRSVLPLVVQARGTQVLHASAVRSPAGAIVALCGQATSGKSTLAAALMQRGLEVVADDALPVREEGTAVQAHPLPFRLRLRPVSAEALDLPVAALDREAAEPGRLAQIVLLEPHDSGDLTVELLDPPDAFGSLMPHAYCFSLRTGTEELVRVYASVCELVPVSRLNFSRGLDRLGDAVDALMPLVADA